MMFLLVWTPFLLFIELTSSLIITEDDRMEKLNEENADKCFQLQEKLGINSFSDLMKDGFIDWQQVSDGTTNRVQLENCLDGLDSRHWDVNAAGDASIQGFAHPFSNRPGTKIDFRVKTPSNKYRIDIFRLGFYNGKGARRIITIQGTPINQPRWCYEEAETQLVDCLNWKISASWKIPKNAVSGVYLARLVREDIVNIPQTKHVHNGRNSDKETESSINTVLQEELSVMNENTDYNFRADASSIPASPTFVNVDRDTSLAWPCGNNDLCDNIKHAYGAQFRHKYVNNNFSSLQNNLIEARASLVYFIVRSNPGEAGEIVVQTLDTTWQAYNNYMAPSTYGAMPLPHHNFGTMIQTRNERSHSIYFTQNEGPHTNVTKVDTRKKTPLRAYKTSFNRPFITRDVRAVNTVFNAEYPLIRFLESNGFDVTYVTGIDVHLREKEIFERTTTSDGQRCSKLYISVGHDEYWSTQQRRNIEYFARDELGMNLAFLSGNEVYWNIRWESSPFVTEFKDTQLDDDIRKKLAYLETADPTTMVVYKESQESRKTDPETKMWTGTFRDERRINPQGAWPENSLTGTIFTVNAWRNDPLRVPYKYSRHRFWRHTDVSKLKKNQTAIL